MSSTEGATAGRLVIVGTPIGNLGDWSPRARQAIVDAALIACEDTRRTGSLLAKHDIANPGMVVANEHTEGRAIERVLEVLAAGGAVALATDAGMPTISDPGAMIVAAVAEAGYETVVVPGPTAASAALALSGFAGGRWVFEGFLPRKGAERTRRLVALAAEERIIVLYEAPHRIVRTLADLGEHLDASRACVIARELTKLHEATWRGYLGDAAQAVGEPRGEYVVVINEAPAPAEVDDDTLLAAIRAARERGLRTKDAAAEVAAAFGVGRNRVYELATR
ncbi:MAG: 16S rRNA (cytidine(1402)-2'-O)-methyltransferase [Actinomycetota bacterium]